MERITRILREHAKRFTWFSIIGGLVFLLGEGILLGGVALGLSSTWAFLIQSIVSVEASFVANWRYVFRRDASFWQSLTASFALEGCTQGEKLLLVRSSDAWKSFWKFNLSRCVFIPIDQVVFMALVWLGMEYLLANVADTAAFTLVNYAIGWLWAFHKKASVQQATAGGHLPRHARVSVAVVIPVKASQRTLPACVHSLLVQDVPIDEIILVGDINDKSWKAIRPFIEAGYVTVLGVDVDSPARDANAKRAIGVNYAIDRGHTILGLTDSDMVLPPGWAAQGVDLIQRGWMCVAGPMRSNAHGFWPTYIDRNPLLPKTPRMSTDYVLDAENFGARKPPVTANVFFTAVAYKQVGDFDVNFVRDYEDYEFFARMVYEGISILCTHLLEANHNHREGFRALAKDYAASGWGCADFVAFREGSKLAKQRRREVRLIRIVVPMALILFAGLLASPFALSAVGAAAATYGLLAAYCVVKARALKGVVFPLVTGIFLAAFLRGFARGQSYNQNNQVNTIVRAVIPLHVP